MNPANNSLSIADALGAARETACLELGPGALVRAAEVFQAQFGAKPALIVADPNTFAAAGRAVLDSLRRTGHPVTEPFLYDVADLYAEHGYVAALERALRGRDVVPVAVGSGTINDLTKLAAHRHQRSYMVVATAASMDGYAAFGASITFEGSKQTFACPAPRAVIADLDVLCAATASMNASGYADLIAKIPAGADWLLSDALGVEPLHQKAWDLVQGGLREAVSDPGGVRTGEPGAIERLTKGLMLSGFAMQAAQSSRPASGAEHQFSHLWDMQHHTFQGQTPSHGFKVGIGTLAITSVYEYLLNQRIDLIDPEACSARYPSPCELETAVSREFTDPQLAAVALAESRAKWISSADLRAQLENLRRIWPELQGVLRKQLLPFDDIRARLQAAGAPVEPEQIGIPRRRLKQTFRQAWFIRRRFTALDVAARCDLLEPALDHIFGPAGHWPLEGQPGT